MYRQPAPTFRDVEGVQVTRDYIGNGNRVLITGRVRVFSGSDYVPGNCVVAYVKGREVEDETVLCREQYEPDTRTALGDFGAYAFRPDREQLKAVAVRMARTYGLPIQDNPRIFE
ncbi:MAG: hypothetical protein GXP27_07575 [Planctomycetes bacterium]|nr:hypothetical protein [Planctomycetota bacterium]